MLAAQAREAGCTAETLADRSRTTRRRIGAALRGAAARADLVIVIAGSSAGRDDYTAEVVAEAGTLLVHGVAVKPGHPVVLGRRGRNGRARRARLPGLRRADVRHLRAPAAGRARGRRAGRPPARAGPARTPRGVLAGRRRLDPRAARPRRRRARRRRRFRAAPACSPRWSAPTGCSSSPPRSRVTTPAREVEVRLLRDLDAVERTIVAIGSHDPVLDLAASLLRARDPAQTLVSGPVGSLSGLVALRDGLCHLRGCHLLDPESRRVHAAVDRARPARPDGRGRPARPSRAGADRRPRQSARHRRPRRPAARALRQPPARGGHARPARPRARARRHRPGRRSPATSARSRPISPSPPPSPRAGRTPAWA